MRKASAAIAALLMVSCSGGGDAPANDAAAAGNEAAEGGTAAGPSAADVASVSLQPGQWETTVEVVRMSAPNMPAGVTPPTPPPTTIRSCLTADQARSPTANFLTGSGDSGGCTFQNFSMEGGRLRGTAQCASSGATMRSTFDGRFTPTGYDMTTQAETEAGGMRMEMETRTTARRTGDC